MNVTFLLSFLILFIATFGRSTSERSIANKEKEQQ